MKKILKFATGAEIPEGAVYLYSCKNGNLNDGEHPEGYQYVWHYFLVDVKD